MMEHKPTLSSNRRAELLQTARKARLHWVLQARDTQNTGSSTYKNRLNLSQIPSANCIQETLDFFNTVVNDGELIDLESILLTSTQQSEEDLDELVNNFSQNSTTDKSTSGYDLFIKKLLHPQANTVVKALQQFITKFIVTFRREQLTKNQQFFPINTNASSNPTPSPSSLINLQNPLAHNSLSNLSPYLDENKHKHFSTQIEEFIQNVSCTIMKDCTLWQSETTEEFEQSRIHLEKFVFLKLFPYLFNCNNEDFESNHRLQERIFTLSFITCEHLDMKLMMKLLPKIKQLLLHQQSSPSSSSSSSSSRHPTTLSNGSTTTNTLLTALPANSFTAVQWKEYIDDPMRYILRKPIELLSQLVSTKSPYDALQCIKLASQAIAQVLKDSYQSLDVKSMPGADEFLPMMILVIKYTNPPFLQSYLKYLQRYLPTRWLVSEAGYLVTNFSSAVMFLEQVDAHALTIDPELFESSMKAMKKVVKEQIQQHIQDRKQQQQQSKSSMTKGLMSSAAGWMDEDDPSTAWYGSGFSGGKASKEISLSDELGLPSIDEVMKEHAKQMKGITQDDGIEQLSIQQYYLERQKPVVDTSSVAGSVGAIKKK